MKIKSIAIYSLLVITCSLGLVGCKRTAEKIERWEARNNTQKLVKALDDINPEIRSAAAKALGNLKAESAVEPLASMLSDQDHKLVITAMKSLISIGGAESEF